jgi:AcrR family transcriptional regulator
VDLYNKTMPEIKKRRDAGRPRGKLVENMVRAAVISELAELGFVNFSIESVAKRAEVNKTTIYRKWKSKDGLIHFTLERLADDFALNIPESCNFQDGLFHLGSEIAKLLESNTGRILFEAAFSLKDSPKASDVAQRKILNNESSKVEDFIKKAIQNQELRADISPIYITTMLAGSIIHRVMIEKEKVSVSWLKTLAEILSRGFKV